MPFALICLSRVSQHAHENKMNCSNLALVFGPTLVQAPTHLEALQLHNDVPAVNVLIQVCIEQHNVIFPTTTAATPPLPPTAEELNSQSLPPSPQVTPVSEVSIVNLLSTTTVACNNSDKGVNMVTFVSVRLTKLGMLLSY